jgi:hypothetical protein
MLQETTANFYNNKLVESGSHHWKDCRLMNEYGHVEGIGY